MITWVRVLDFQLVSLKLIATALLRNSPLGINQPGLLERGLYTTRDLPPMYFSKPVRLIFAEENTGARVLADELQRVALELQPTISYKVFGAMEATALIISGEKPTHCLLYLNDKTFSGGGTVGDVVLASMQNGVTMALVQEQDTSRGACSFRNFFDSCPKVRRTRLIFTLALGRKHTHRSPCTCITGAARCKAVQHARSATVLAPRPSPSPSRAPINVPSYQVPYSRAPIGLRSLHLAGIGCNAWEAGQRAFLSCQCSCSRLSQSGSWLRRDRQSGTRAHHHQGLVTPARAPCTFAARHSFAARGARRDQRCRPSYGAWRESPGPP